MDALVADPRALALVDEVSLTEYESNISGD